MNREIQYTEKSELLQQWCDADTANAIKLAQQSIFSGLHESIENIKRLEKSVDDDISLRASRERLLLAGQYVDRKQIKHSGGLTIEANHAADIIAASSVGDDCE